MMQPQDGQANRIACLSTHTLQNDVVGGDNNNLASSCRGSSNKINAFDLGGAAGKGKGKGKGMVCYSWRDCMITAQAYGYGYGN